MELLPWIDASKLNAACLNENENAVDYLIEHFELITMKHLFRNKSFKVLPFHLNNADIFPNVFLNTQPGIEDIIKQIPQRCWSYICKNPRCIDLIQETNPIYYDWKSLSKNPKAIPILIKNINHIDWKQLCMNPCKEAIDLLMQYPEKIDWLTFSSNPYAIDILRQNRYKIDYWGLCWNPYAIDLIEASINKKYIVPILSWIGLSQNRNAIHILEKNQDKIDWMQISLNPGIFQPNYKRLTVERMNVLREELMQKTLHPSKIQYWLDNGMSIEDLPE
jgi:hypothetical protein|uniref:Uncharacterized protein n=1 Tax=viral metagenome TaxID=1070528 RepID=A0A6C0B9Y7_9ZZZZ